MIKFTDDKTGWQGNYVMEVRNTKGANIDNIKLIGGDTALLVNDSDVTLTGKIDISGNKFCGIEVSKEIIGLENSTLTANGTLVNGTEAYNLPTINLVKDKGIVIEKNIPSTILNVRINEIQYYLVDTNSVEL